MREDGSWFANWEEELPSPDELMPLSQTLITPDLAAAFDIASSAAGISAAQNQTHLAASAAAAAASAEEFDSVVACDGVSGDGEPARTLKRPRLVWTPQLHKRFVDAVAHLGIKNAVPKTIMQLMNVDGLTRENVASHLQKYRLYLKRMQGLSVAGDPSAGSGNPASSADHLFAAHHHQFVPFVPIGNYPQPPHHHFIGGPPPPLPQYGSGSGFENRFLARQQFAHHRNGDEFVPESRKILTLFPAGDD